MRRRVVWVGVSAIVIVVFLLFNVCVCLACDRLCVVEWFGCFGVCVSYVCVCV